MRAWQTARYSAEGCRCLQSDAQQAPPSSRSSDAAGDGRGAMHIMCTESALLLQRCRACICADCPAEPRRPWQAPLMLAVQTNTLQLWSRTKLSPLV